jgi:signal transduction histidine kinase/DNA-binding NarL/FixJ family response regulator
MVIKSLPLKINMIGLSSLAIMSLVLGVSGASVVGANEARNASSRAELAVSEMAGDAERMLAQGYAVDGLPNFDELCASLVGSDPILGGAALFDAAGRKLYSGGKEAVAFPEGSRPMGKDGARVALLDGGALALHPVFRSGGDMAGFALVSVDRGMLASAIGRSVLLMVAMSCALVAALVLAQGLLYWRSIGIPIRRLVATADSLASGDAGKVADLERFSGPGEIGTIYAAFARLVSGLLEAKAGLVRQNEDLDKTVRMRTALLEGAYAELADDLDRRTALEAQLVAAKDEAEAADRAKSAFLAAMSHEIRTPMNSVLGYLELLSRGSLGAEEREHVSVIESNARHLLALIDDILDFSKIESGRLELADEAFDPASAFIRSARMLGPKAAEKGVELDIRADPAPACRGDGLRLGQVVVNLVGNAVKFTPGGGRVEASLGASKEEGGVRLSVSVSDTGIGIAKDRQATIFEPFRQADASISGRYGGTGLGLAISSHIVGLMGGAIRVESEIGKGSRFGFSVLLPEAEAGAGTEARAGAAPAPSSFAGAKALVAEDTRDSRLLIERMLGLLGLSVDSVSDGAEAIELFERNRYDLVILDGQMPLVDGVEAARRIRAQELRRGRGRTPILALSAKVLPREREDFLRAGADGFVAKPVSMASLAEALSRVGLGASAGAPGPAGGPAAAAEIASRLGLDAEFAAELLAEFAASLPGRLETIEAALLGRDAERLGRASHGLRGSALNLGLDAIAVAAAHGEAAVAGEPGEERWPEAELAVVELRGAIRSFLDSEPGA